MEVYAKPWELLPEIEKCRSKFRNMLYSVSHDLTDSTRERIRSATEDITKSMITFKVNEKDKHDNTIFVEFKLNGLHRFLNINLFKHSDYTKRSEISDNGVILQPAVPMCGNYGMDEKRENHRLERYMQKMRLEYDVDVWDYKEDMIPLLEELWRMADLNNFHEETVMLFYLVDYRNKDAKLKYCT